MKRFFLFAAITIATSVQAWADNTVQTVGQITSATTMSEDVDLHITSTTPFTATGSINITNTEHAVLFIDYLRPSQAKAQLGFIKINGEDAEEGVNCQLRLWGQGTAIFPYGKETSNGTGFQPLTTYTETNFGGESCNKYGLEHSGGFMNTLSAAKLNNKIRSFKLKRGYMVTFSLRTEGRGYSRCFIANDADLEFKSLPALMDQRISSYRVFRWNDVGKAGVANLNNENLAKVNATWTYEWGLGEYRGTDYECVAHMNHRWGPSAAAMGATDYCCHIKTDNEPGNDADPQPATVDEVLGRWEDCMRTGKRLLTPSSHDGSTAWFKNFLDSIDARGWRCEVLDVHCYWDKGSYGNLKSGWADKYHRPIWITEFVYGASWNNNGVFAEWRRTEADNLTGMTEIFNNINSWNWVERYAYWNDEAWYSKIIREENKVLTTLTPTGEFFRDMKVAGGYNKNYDYIPTTPRMKAPKDLTVEWAKGRAEFTLKWTNENGDLTEQAIIQENRGKKWENIDTLVRYDNASMTYTIKTTISDAIGNHKFRILNKDFDKGERMSNEVQYYVGGALSYGDVMVGTIESTASVAKDAEVIYFARQEKEPVVLVGMPTMTNSSNAFSNHLTSISKENFKFFYEPWNKPSAMTISAVEKAGYLIIKPGTYKWGEMQAVADTCRYMKDGTEQLRSSGDTIDVTFPTPFPEGVTPVVFVQNFYPLASGAPCIAKVFDVTNTGFKMKLVKQIEETKAISSQMSFYFALTPGSAKLGDSGKRIHAGIGADPVGGIMATGVAVPFTTLEGDTLFNSSPFYMAAAQTHNLDTASVLRIRSERTSSVINNEGTRERMCYGINVRRQIDPSISKVLTNNAAVNGDYVGWIVIDDDPNAETGIKESSRTASPLYVQVSGRRIKPSVPNARIYNLNGMRMQTNTNVAPGIYIVTDGKSSIKVKVN